MRQVIGHFEVKAGRFSVVEILNWMGTKIPLPTEIDRLDYRRANPLYQHLSRFYFVEPRKKKDQSRLRRPGFTSPPKRDKRGYKGLPLAFLDDLLKRCLTWIDDLNRSS